SSATSAWLRLLLRKNCVSAASKGSTSFRNQARKSSGASVMVGRPTFEALCSISNLSVIYPQPVPELEGLFRSHPTPRSRAAESLVNLGFFLGGEILPELHEAWDAGGMSDVFFIPCSFLPFEDQKHASAGQTERGGKTPKKRSAISFREKLQGKSCGSLRRSKSCR